jgi:two-component system, cell cycle sensor histidine kinase and response regulator CckA
MWKTLQSSWLHYGIAILSVVAASMITWSLWPLMQRSIFMFFVLAVMLSAWRGGHGPGLVSTILSAVVGDYLYFTSSHTISPFDSRAAVPFFLFIPFGLLVSIVTAESRRTRRGLAETTEILTSTIQASPLAIIGVGTDGNIKTWNPAAERIFGWSAQEVIGSPNPIAPENKLKEHSWLPKEAELSTGGFTARDARGLKKDSSFIDISLSTGPLRDFNGNYTGTMAVIADITEQKRTQRALQESEQQFRATFEQAAVGIAQSTREGKLLKVNQKFCDFLGYSEAELLGLTIRDITPVEDLDRSLRNMEDLWTREIQASTIEKRYVRKDGSSVSANLTASVVLDGSGNPLYFIGVIEDTTEERRQEEALRESEERFRVMFEHAAVGIAQLSLDGKWLMVNQRLCAILGYTQAELLEPTFQEITPAEDLDDSLAAREALLAGGRETFTVEKRYLRKDGSLVWTRVSVSLVRDSSGDPESFLSVIEDISERRQAEQTLLRLATAVEQAAETIVITDTDGAIQYANPAFERTSGYSRDEIIGQNSRVLKSGKQGPSFYGDLWETIKRGEVWTGHFTNRKKDGSLYEEEATISPVRGASGNVVNFVAVKRDVTKEVVLENQLIQAQKMEAVGQLAGGVAHDFNNLLTAVIGYSQLVLRRLGDRDPMRADIAEIEKAGLRASELTGQLLAFSRKQVFQPKNLALNALVTDLQRMLRRLIPEDIDLVAVLDLELGTVKADPVQLQQVIMNLIVNARDAMPQGGKITIETANVYLGSDYAAQHLEVLPGAYCSLAISDNGCGMDEETKSHIFEPFFTTKEIGRGTGLGLSTVYGIVKQSGGFISVYSEPGLGTTFNTYLPRIVELTEDEDRRQTQFSLPLGDETLLLVEDEAAVRELAARVLRDHGYTVLEASDPLRALNAIAGHSPDEVQLLVTDVVMPHMSGRDLAERLAPLRPKMRVLYVSGYTEGAIVHQGVLDEGTPFLQKPFTPEALVRKVREVLDTRPHAGRTRV